MKKIAFILILLLFAVPAFALSPDELAAKVQENYDRIRDLKAEFTQATEVKAMNMKKEGSGTMLIKKPGLLRYTYTKPEKQELIVRGEEVLFYLPAQNQVIKKTLERAVMDRTPATFLAGLGKITDSFNVSVPKQGAKDASGDYLLELVPKGPSMGVENILLTLDHENYTIKSFSFRESSGNTNTIALRNIKTNTGIKDAAFDFKIPKGASLISD